MARKLNGATAQPEHEITEELGAEEAPDGTTVVSEDVAKEEGAANAEAAQSNRRRQETIKKKRGGEKNVPWNERDACLLYDDIIQLWPANTLVHHVTRLTGMSASMYLAGCPRNGRELYEAIKMQFHGRREECEYSVVFRDGQRMFDRGRGKITMPDTTDEFPAQSQAPAQPVQQQPQQPPPGYYPPGYQPPPGYVPPAGYPPPPPGSGQPPQGYGQPPQPQQPPPPYVQPIVVQAPPAPAPQAPPQQPPPQYVPPSQLGPDIATVMALQKQLSDISARLDATLKGQAMPTPAPAMQPPAPAPASHPAPAAPPPIAPPPGYVIMTMANGQQVMMHASEMGLGAGPGSGGGPGGGAGPFGGPRRGGMPSMFDRSAQPPPPAAPPAPPAPPPPTAAEQFAQAIGLMRAAADAATSIQRIMPGLTGAATPVAAAAPAPTPEPEDEGPTKIIKLGDINAVQNTSDGSIRLVDTALANSDKIMSWIDKQKKDYQDAMLRQQALAQGQPLPPAQPAQTYPQQQQPAQTYPPQDPSSSVMPAPTFPFT